MLARAVGGGLRSPLSTDLNFNHYKAVAMAVDQGPTLPSSPVTGQWFLHTPTGRSVLLMYNGTTWTPIISLGAITVYVDPTGTDTQNNGGAAGTSAFKTIGYAINQVPGTLSGNVVINVVGGTYAESLVVQGKNFTGNYSITLSGAKTVNVSGTATSGANLAGNGSAGYGTLTDTTKAWTANAYQNLFVEITGGTGVGQIRPIHANTATVLTITGRWDTVPDATSTYNIFSLATVINGTGLPFCVKLDNGQKNGVLQYLKIMNGGLSADRQGGIMVFNNSSCDINYCHIENCNYWGVNYLSSTGTLTGSVFRLQVIGDVAVNGGADVYVIKQCRFTGWKNRSFHVAAASVDSLYQSYIGLGTGNVGVYSVYSAIISTDAYLEIDGASLYNIWILDNGVLYCNSLLGAQSTQVIKNSGGWGIFASHGGMGENVSYLTYSGNVSGTYTPATATAGGNS